MASSPLGSPESALLSTLRSQLAESVIQAEDAGDDMQRVTCLWCPLRPAHSPSHRCSLTPDAGIVRCSITSTAV